MIVHKVPILHQCNDELPPGSGIITRSVRELYDMAAQTITDPPL